MDINNLVKGAMNVMGADDASQAASNLVNDGAQAVSNVVDDASQATSNVVNDATNSASNDMGGMMDNLMNQAKGMMGDSNANPSELVNELKDGLSSKIGEMAGAAGLAGGMGGLMEKAKDMMGGVTPDMQGAVDGAKSAKNIVDDVVGNLVDQGLQAADKVTGGMASTVGKMAGVKDQVVQQVKNVIPDDLENAASSFLGKK